MRGVYLRGTFISKFEENENVKWVLSFLDVTELGQTERKLLTY